MKGERWDGCVCDITSRIRGRLARHAACDATGGRRGEERGTSRWTREEAEEGDVQRCKAGGGGKKKGDETGWTARQSSSQCELGGYCCLPSLASPTDRRGTTELASGTSRHRRTCNCRWSTLCT
eukprot:764074-Hanusia_phi.AAC.3